MNRTRPAGPSRRSLLGALAAGSTVGLTGCGTLAEARLGGDSLAAMAQKAMDFFFFVVEEAGVRRTARRLGYAVQTVDAHSDANAQVQQCQSFLVKDPAFIVIDAVDSWALGEATIRAKKRSIPIAAIDTPMKAGWADISIRVDDHRAGQLAALRTVELLKAKYGRARGRVLNVYGSLQSFGWRQRKEGWDSIMRRHPNIEAMQRPSEGVENTARAVTDQVLSQYDRLDAAHGPSDSLTRGVVRALRARGKTAPAGAANHVILTSIDAEPQALRWLDEGILDSAIAQDPVAFTQIAVEMVHRYTLRGKPIPTGSYSDPKRYYWKTATIEDTDIGPVCVIPPFYVDKTNRHDPRLWANVVEQQWGLKQ